MYFFRMKKKQQLTKNEMLEKCIFTGLFKNCEKNKTILFRMKKKCSLDSTCSEDSMYEHCPGPEILLHRENFLIYNKKVPSH